MKAKEEEVTRPNQCKGICVGGLRCLNRQAFKGYCTVHCEQRIGKCIKKGV